MPYIVQQKRDEITLGMAVPQTAGELNFVITSICLEYLNNTKKDYQHMNDVVGALESCKLEFYRRLIGPYENLKISSNGDVY
jgi:hypothetical protein